ncbi:phage portal protein [Candidatus Bathyarchaeota archaeon]|nr:MAG: phage portal protein [Candidatus Bathyarchaeota archaeon]
MRGTSWPGLVPVLHRLLHGSARSPKAKRYHETTTPTTSVYYEGMHGDYRWFRQDELVRRCVLVNAFFATMAAGFETVLEAARPGVEAGDYEFVKERVDGVNRRVNLDQVLFVAQVKRSVYGKAGFEIVRGEDGYPSWLLSLQSPRLRPNLDRDWGLTGFRYEGRDGFYGPDDVLFFANLQLEADLEGLSDVEPIRDVCRARHNLLREDFPEIVRTLWAPYTILQADTSGLSEEEAARAVEELVSVARAGKSIVVNESVTPTVVDMTPDIKGLCDLLGKLEQAIIGNFGTPRFLLGKPIENRATAYAELEAYVQGPITHIQRYFKREIEAQWYDRWTRKILEDEGKAVPEGEIPPVLVKHRWNPVRVSDVYEMAKAVAILHGRGQGPIGDRLEKAWEMMGWDPSELEEDET